MNHYNQTEQALAVRAWLLGLPCDPGALAVALEAQQEEALAAAEDSAATELENETEPLENRIAELEAELEEKEYEIAELKEALEPFGALAQEHQEGPDEQPLYAVNEAEITYGDIRRAKKLAT